jgi:ABC-type branched-subunit amino acid transport system ATPase component
MGRTFQNLSVVGELTVLENVRVGASRFGGYGVGSAILGLPKVRRRDAVTTRIARAAIDAVGLAELSNVPAASLPYGDLRRLELARALCLNPRLLLLDEPAAGLDNTETRDLVDAIRGIREHWGVTVLLVEHDLELVRSLAEFAFVMDFGTMLAGGPVHEVLNDPAVIAAYVGGHRATAGKV